MSSAHAHEKVTKQVLRYFLRNPQSADSLEGVARWRLLEERIHHTLVETQSALEQLVAEKYLRVVSISGSEHIYTLNTAKRKEAEEFVGPIIHDG